MSLKQKRPYVHLTKKEVSGVDNFKLYYSIEIAQEYDLVNILDSDPDRTADHYGGAYPEGNAPVNPRNVTIEIQYAPGSPGFSLCASLDLSTQGSFETVDVHVLDLTAGITPADKRLKGKTVVVYEHADDDSSGG